MMRIDFTAWQVEIRVTRGMWLMEGDWDVHKESIRSLIYGD
jgi:hypothetical protein